MAHKKGAGSTDNGRDSAPQYLGVKKFGGEIAKAGNIIVRQRGTKFHAGTNVYMSKDHTLHASVAGVVCFKRSREDRRIVYIMPTEGDGLAVKEVIVAKSKVATTPKAPKPPRPIVAKAPVAKVVPVVKTVVETPKVEVKAAPVVVAPVVEVKAAPVVVAPVAEVKAEPVVVTPKVETTVTEKVTVTPASGGITVIPKGTTTVTSSKGGSVTVISKGETETVRTSSEKVTVTSKGETETVKPTSETVSVISKGETVVSTPSTKVTSQGAEAADDLKKIEGIGPKIEELLNEAGINTFAQLSETSADKVKEILEAAGPRFTMHDPTTWAKQAALAAAGSWDELKAWQDVLDGGKE